MNININLSSETENIITNLYSTVGEQVHTLTFNIDNIDLYDIADSVIAQILSELQYSTEYPHIKHVIENHYTTLHEFLKYGY